MKATITSKEVPIAESTEKKTEPFRSAARRFSRGTSALRYAQASSSPLIAFNSCNRSMTRFSRSFSTKINAATAPNIKAGAATWPITSES
jgi:hypothetical protein